MPLLRTIDTSDRATLWSAVMRSPSFRESELLLAPPEGVELWLALLDMSPSHADAKYEGLLASSTRYTGERALGVFPKVSRH